MGDNVDMRITPRQMSRREGSKDFQFIAVKSRIVDYALSPEAPAKDNEINIVCLSLFNL